MEKPQEDVAHISEILPLSDKDKKANFTKKPKESLIL